LVQGTAKTVLFFDLLFVAIEVKQFRYYAHQWVGEMAKKRKKEWSSSHFNFAMLACYLQTTQP